MTRRDHDPPRLLHARSEHGYTTRTDQALPAEPEAVSADEQKRLTDAAKKQAHEQQLLAWMVIAKELRRLLDLARSQPFARRIDSDLRVFDRQIDRVTRELR